MTTKINKNTGKNIGKNKNNINENMRERYTKIGRLSLTGLIILMLVLPSVSAMTASLDISASGWPPCPASTGTSYTVTTHVTGTSSSSSTYLWIGVWDYISGKYIAYTGVIGPYSTNIDVTKTLTITTPSVSGDISYSADVYYWDWDQSKWVFADYVNSGIKRSGTPSISLAASASPNPITSGSQVSISATSTGTTNSLNIYEDTFHYNKNSGSWENINYSYYYFQQQTYSATLTATHTPTNIGTETYYSRVFYYDRCSSSWVFANSKTTTITVNGVGVVGIKFEGSDENTVSYSGAAYTSNGDVAGDPTNLVWVTTLPISDPTWKGTLSSSGANPTWNFPNSYKKNTQMTVRVDISSLGIPTGKTVRVKVSGNIDGSTITFNPSYKDIYISDWNSEDYGTLVFTSSNLPNNIGEKRLNLNWEFTADGKTATQTTTHTVYTTMYNKRNESIGVEYVSGYGWENNYPSGYMHIMDWSSNGASGKTTDADTVKGVFDKIWSLSDQGYKYTFPYNASDPSDGPYQCRQGNKPRGVDALLECKKSACGEWAELLYSGIEAQGINVKMGAMIANSWPYAGYKTNSIPAVGTSSKNWCFGDHAFVVYNNQVYDPTFHKPDAGVSKTPAQYEDYIFSYLLKCTGIPCYWNPDCTVVNGNWVLNPPKLQSTCVTYEADNQGTWTAC